MKLFDKLFNKKRDVKVETPDECDKYIREDLVIFVMKMDEPTLREEKDYCLIGYLNEKQTKFKDIATGNVYELDRAYNPYCRYILREGKNRYTPVVREKQGENFYWFARFAGDYRPFNLRDKYIGLSYELLRWFYSGYVYKQDDDIIDKTTIVEMKQELNSYIERKIRKELDERAIKRAKEIQEQAVEQQKANEIAKVREGYSKDF